MSEEKLKRTITPSTLVSLDSHPTISTYGPGRLHFHDYNTEQYQCRRPRTYRDLVQAPVIRQWLHHGRLYREHTERTPSRLELFFDLVFVAIAHQLSDSAAENANGWNLLKFILVFYPSWNLWTTYRRFVNQSGTDDVLQRVLCLFLMAILVGYSANASGITLGVNVILPGGVREGDAAVAGRDPALVAAAAFFLVAKLSHIVFVAIYAVSLPRFRKMILIQFVNSVGSFFIYFPLLFVTSPTAIIVLSLVGLCYDMMGAYLIGLGSLELKRQFRNARKISSREGDPEIRSQHSHSPVQEKTPLAASIYIPAINIEHHIERTASFVIIILGEMVMEVVYKSTTGSIGLSRVYLNAVLGLIVAFNLGWLYFDAECTRQFVHALRRHWFTSVSWSTVHWPLSCSLILVSAALSRLTVNQNVDSGVRWFFGGGLGCGLTCITAMGIMHKCLDPDGSSVISRTVQLSIRMLVALLMCLLPLAKNLSSTALVGIAAGATTFLIIEETIGKLEKGGGSVDGGDADESGGVDEGIPVDDDDDGPPTLQDEGVQADLE